VTGAPIAENQGQEAQCMRRFLLICGWIFLWAFLPVDGFANPEPGAAPIKIKATRQGRVLHLDCQLGPSLRNRRSDWRNPPTFTVYKDGEEVGSGTFEYG
jgi:hypothetical protein